MKLEQIIENYCDATEQDEIFIPNAVAQARIIFQHNPLEDIIKILRNLMDKRIDDSMGICFNLDRNMNESSVFGGGYNIVEWFSAGWEHHTGDECYPVPETGLGLWVGVGYSLRVSLINHMINQLEQLEL